ncbi:somatostatin receptor type 2-like [Siniperca chuatsi]|uniref:somatostatin receptor type 2-like n=1 Tax=Siniperca chuatsi TaxID=119488 RepID=UPI001CE0BB65|nr:somatostatin receptor type 2-like [Siniperca chuatsi]XP_044040196.1 somatostatin receptor type 2-like [Siniperca chuatsi]
MSVNSSSSLNVTLVPPPLPSSNSSISPLYVECLKSMASNVIFTMYTITNVLLLPLYILILYMGFQRWRRQCSVPGGQSTSHSDFFTYHIVAVEIFGVFGSLIYTLGIYTNGVTMLTFGMCVSCIIFPGQTLFHCLTCVERYLAVVHPITYMHMRETVGVRIRNISIVCVWLLSFGWIGLTILYLPGFPAIPFLCMLGISLIVIFFCCLSVLCVLTHSGPGEVGGTRERADQSKHRAFHIICAILGVLLLRFFGLLVILVLPHFHGIRLEDLCGLMDSGIYLTVPSSLVLPLLFLHKTGKLACCRHSVESG